MAQVKLDATRVALGTRIWRPVAVRQKKDGGYEYRVHSIKLGTGKKGSALCRATPHFGSILPGELTACDHNQTGLCVFVDVNAEGLPADWTCLIVTTQLRGSVVAKPIPTARATLLNVYPDPIRQKRIGVERLTMAEALPPHTGNFVFPGDRGFVSCAVEGTGVRDKQTFVHSMKAGFRTRAVSVQKREITVSWLSDGIEFHGTVPAESFDVIRGH